MQLTFISYDGKYPNLCAGQLILAIDGVQVVFPDYCLSSGGSVYFDDDFDAYINEGEWDIACFPEDFPEDLKKEAVDLVNANVPYGCCGGCI